MAVRRRGRHRLDAGPGFAVALGARSLWRNSSAAEAGRRAGDVIAMIDETAIETGYQLRRHLREVDAAGTVALGIVRDGEPMSIRVMLRDAGQ